jgi:hypothetical protein
LGKTGKHIKPQSKIKRAKKWDLWGEILGRREYETDKS